MRINLKDCSATALVALLSLAPIAGSAATTTPSTQAAYAIAANDRLPGSPVAQEPSATQPAPTQEKPDMQQPTQTPSDKDATASSVFTGTIVKDGTSFLLRESTGNVYHLDPASTVEPFAGKTVKVTGKLEASSKVIHGDTIEAVQA